MRLFISRTPSSLELNDDSGPPHSYPHERSCLHHCVFSSYFQLLPIQQNCFWKLVMCHFFFLFWKVLSDALFTRKFHQYCLVEFFFCQLKPAMPIRRIWHLACRNSFGQKQDHRVYHRQVLIQFAAWFEHHPAFGVENIKLLLRFSTTVSFSPEGMSYTKVRQNFLEIHVIEFYY